MHKSNLRPQGSRRARFRKLRGLCRSALAAALTLALGACGPGHGTDCLKSTGPVVTQRRAVAAGLVTVTAFDNVDLRLVQDAQTYAEVRAGENLIDDIELTRKGNSLEISNSSRCNWARSYGTPREVTLHLPRIANVFLRGQGNGRTVGEFAQDTLFFHLVGAGDYDLTLRGRYVQVDQYELGDMTLRGAVEELNFTVGGAGRLFAQGLATRRCYFRTTRDSDGDAHVRATDVLDGVLAGNGTLYYSGAPAAVGIRVTGKGRLQPE